MKVGDLVQISVEALMSGEPQETVEGSGVIVERVDHEVVKILWDDGVVEEAHVNDLFVLREAIEDEIEWMALALADH